MNTHPEYPKRIDINLSNYDYNTKIENYTSPVVIKNQGIWADKDDVSIEELKSRQIWKNNKLISLSDSGIKFINNRPKNPCKTGLSGRGLLGRFGPNHAADPIVTRFNYKTFTIEFVAVLRNDTNPPQWCIPGGMVDPGESATATLKREFKEEAASQNSENIINSIFKNGKTLYSGQVYNDPRTTDDAWIETYVVHYHISNTLANKLKLTTQPDENSNVKWISCNSDNLYADHSEYIKMAKKRVYWLLFYKFCLFGWVIDCFYKQN